MAPSAHHLQHWRFSVLFSLEFKIRLADEMGADFRRDLKADGLSEDEIAARIERSRQRILGAPVSIVLSMDTSLGDDYPDENRRKAETIMGIQSVANAGLQLMLAAHAEGLGSVWTCGPVFAPAPVSKALDLPANWLPQALFFFGYPAESPFVRSRKELDQIAQFL